MLISVCAGLAWTLRVRVTTMKKKSLPIQYLLSADQRLRRLSLRRLAKHRKATRNLRRSIRPQKGRRTKTAAPSPASTWPIVLSVIGIIAAGGFLSVRLPSRQPDTPIADPQPTLKTEMLTRPATETSNPKKIVPSKTAGPIAAAKTDPPARTMAVKPPSSPAERKKPAPEAVSRSQPEAASLPAKGFAAAPVVADSGSKAKSNTDESAVVTVTGCLEASESGFRLRDTSGVDTLKSRSWKTGFLTKRSSSIDVVDAADTLRLPTLVGQRVSATGTLMNHEMRARSLESVSPSCR